MTELSAVGVRLSVASVLLTLTSFAITANAIPPLTTSIARDLSTEYETFGYVFLFQYSCFALASCVGGWATERLGLRPRLLVMGGVFAAGAAFLLGPLIQAFRWFVIWVVFLGLSGGLTETFSSIIIAGHDRPGSSKMINLSQVFYCLGAIGTPYVVAALLQAQIAWRTTFVFFGCATVAFGLIFASFYRDVRTEADQAAERRGERVTGRAVINRKLFVLFAAAMFVYVINEISLASWISPYFEKRLGISVPSAAWRLATFWTGLVVGRGLMLVLPDKLTQIPSILLGAVGMTAGCVLLSVVGRSWLATALVILVGLSAGPVWPGIVSLSRQSPRVTAVVIAVGALGAALGPLLSSYVIRYLGLQYFFPTIAGGCCVLVVIVVGVRRELNRSQEGDYAATDPRSSTC